MPDRTSKNGPSDANQQEVTVLFADISGFTAMSEKLDPEAVTDVMNGCFTDLESVVTAHGGTIDKYIGDCVMAVFGLGESTSNAAGAVAAAAEILPALGEFNRKENLPSPLGVHIGLESGVALVGEIGGREHRALTVSGPPVTVASRLEDVSDVGQIFVGPEVFRETTALCEYRTLDPIRVRDAAEPLQIYQFIRHRRLREHIKRDSERRQATVVFASINGFKDLGDRLSPAELSDALNLCFGALESAVQTYGGVIDKYIGETVMALFGVPNAIEDAPKQALNATIEMRNRLENLSGQKEIPTVLTLSAGVNTGLVIAGEVGGRIKRDFTVMGDTVNLAARLKESAAAGEILIGPGTYRYTEGDFEFEEAVPLALKGKADPVDSRRVLSETKQIHRTSSHRERIGRRREEGAPMVGRSEELQTIRTVLEELCEGRGAAVSIDGEAGVGKTRLLAEILQLPEARKVTVLQGRCISLGGNLSYHPFVDLLRRWADIDDEDREEEAAEKVEAAIRTLVGQRTPAIYPFIARIMSLRLSETHALRLQGIEGEALENMITNAVRELLHAIASSRPLLLVLEDLHWADQSSVKLLDTLLRLPRESPVLFFFLARPDFAATSGRVDSRAQEVLAERRHILHLGPLSDQESLILAQELLDIDDLPVSFRQIVTRKAEGNPFYIEEVVRSLIDSGAIVEEAGQYRVTKKIETVEIPNTIQEVIMSRVDRLDEATRHVVQIASVIGRSALFSIIGAILRDDHKLGSDGEAELASLKEKQLLIERRATSLSRSSSGGVGSELEFVFKHALAQETIYASLLQKVRKELHLRVAVAIESLFAERISDFYGMLAYHYSRTEQLVKAEDYLFKAGDEAASSAASGEALNFFRDAYQIYQQIHGDGGDPVRRSALEKRIGLALLNTGEQTESIDHFDNALRLLGEPVPKSIWAAGIRFVGDLAAVLVHIYVGHRFRTPGEAINIEHESNVCEIFYHRGQAETTSDPKRLFLELPNGIRRFNKIDPRKVEKAGSIYVTAALIFAYSGFSFPISRRMLDIAQSLVRPDNPRDSFVYRVFNFIYHYFLGNWDEEYSIELNEVRDALERGQVWDATLFVGLEVDRLLKRGEFDRTEPLLDLLMEISDNYGYSYAESNHNGMLAVVLSDRRQLHQAAEVARSHYIRSDEPPIRVFALGIEAKSWALLGKADRAADALALADKAIRKSESISSWHMSSYWCAQLHLGLATLRAGDHTSSNRRRAKRAVRGAVRATGYVARNRVEVLRLAAETCALLGEPSRARRFFSRAMEEGRRMNTRPELARLSGALAEFLDDEGTLFLGGTAAEHRADAEKSLADLGLSWDLEQFQRASATREDAA